MEDKPLTKQDFMYDGCCQKLRGKVQSAKRLAFTMLEQEQNNTNKEVGLKLISFELAEGYIAGYESAKNIINACFQIDDGKKR
jgi:hypothetical protein